MLSFEIKDSRVPLFLPTVYNLFYKGKCSLLPFILGLSLLKVVGDDVSLLPIPFCLKKHESIMDYLWENIFWATMYALLHTEKAQNKLASE